MGIDLQDRQQDETSDFPDHEHPSTPLSATERAESDKIFKRYYLPDEKKDGLHPKDLRRKDDGATDTAIDSSVGQEMKELGAHTDPNDLNYTANSKGGGRRKQKTKVGGIKKRLQIAVIAGLVSIILSLVSFFALLPQKLNSIVSNIDKKYFATAEEAVERRGEIFFSEYVRRHILPSLNGSCTTTKVSKTCSVRVDGDSGPKRLYRAWADARLEQKLSDRHGITFERSGSGSGTKYNMNVRGESVDITGFATSNNIELRDVGRSEVRAAWKDAYKRETRLKRIMYHFSVGRLLERKYGIKRCVVACKTRDNYTDWKDRKKSAFKAKLIRRVIAPRDEALSIAFDCIFVSNCSQRVENGEDHNRRDIFQQRVDDMLERLSREYGQEFTEEGVQKMLRELDALEANGDHRGGKYQRFIMKKLLQKVFKEETADQVSDYAVKSIPIIGWISIADTVTNLATKVGPAIRKYRYVTNSMAMIQLYSMYKTHVDEIKVGNVDAEIVGSFVEALGDQVGNGETAELSPLYEEVINGPGRAGYSSSFFSPVAFAEGTQKQYTCDDGEPVAPGELICDEEKLTDSTEGAAFLESVSDSGVLAVARPIAATAGAPVRAIFGPLDKITGFILSAPGVRNLVGLVANLAKLAIPFMQAVLNYLVPIPMGPNMSGARNVNMTIGGGNAAGNEFAHYGVGGKVLSDGEVQAIRTKRETEDIERFARLPFTDRMFSKDETRSFVSQFALAMPSSRSGLVSNFLGFRPVGFISSIFSSKRASAETTIPTKDPFGIIQYGYALNDPVLSADPEKYTPEYCAQEIKTWEEAVIVDEATGMEAHTTTSPCILEEVAISSAGGYFDDGLIPTKDKIVESLGSNYEITPPGQCPNNPVTDSETVVVEGIRVHKCIESNTREMVLAAKSAGLDSFGGSGWRDTAKQVELRKINGCPDVYNSPAESCVTPTARPGLSMHERGLAIDVACNGSTIGSSSPCFTWLVSNANRFGFFNLPSEPWHWSINGR